MDRPGDDERDADYDDDDFVRQVEWASTHDLKDAFVKHSMLEFGLDATEWTFLSDEGDPEVDLDSFNEWLFKRGEPTWATWSPLCPQQQVDQNQTGTLPLPPPDQPPGEMESGNGQTPDDLCGAATPVEEAETKETAADPSTQPEKTNAAASIKETKEKDTKEPADPVNQPPENPSAAATVQENETNELADPSAPSEPPADPVNQPPENPSAAATVEENETNELADPSAPSEPPADPINQPPENTSAAAPVKENETNELADPSASSEPPADPINQPPENTSAAAVVEEIQKSTDLGNEMTDPEKSVAPSITEVKNNNIPPMFQQPGKKAKTVAEAQAKAKATAKPKSTPGRGRGRGRGRK